MIQLKPGLTPSSLNRPRKSSLRLKNRAAKKKSKGLRFDRVFSDANVAPFEVEIRAGETIVREGEVLTVGDIEKLEELGLTRPRVQAGTVIGNALIAILVAALLVGYLLRFEPEVWHRNRSVLLFFLALIVSAVAVRVAADRTLWAFAVPTSATVLLIGILLRNSAGIAMAGALAVLAGVMNRDALEPAVFVLAGGLAGLLTITRAERLNAFVRVTRLTSCRTEVSRPPLCGSVPLAISP